MSFSPRLNTTSFAIGTGANDFFMKHKTYHVSLTPYEMTILDGSCSEEVQQDIDDIKIGTKYSDNEWIASFIAKAVKDSRFECRGTKMNYCSMCGAKKTYMKFKSGPRKGMDNEKKPWMLRGYVINEGCIKFVGSGDFCNECNKKYKIIETIMAVIKDNDLRIDTGENGKYKIDKLRECYKCGKQFYESERRKIREYGGRMVPRGCPFCEADTTKWKPSFRVIER